VSGELLTRDCSPVPVASQRFPLPLKPGDAKVRDFRPSHDGLGFVGDTLNFITRVKIVNFQDWQLSIILHLLNVKIEPKSLAPDMNDLNRFRSSPSIPVEL
jgi:hypothetical protein